MTACVDKDDVDDDNDGILDTEEGTDDLDNDGIINSLDPDTDGDGCKDVIEAGFTDTNDDGMLGPNASPAVDNTGKVTGQGGYTTPSAVDGDANGTKDYKEVGAVAQITLHPVDALREVNDAVTFTVTATTTGSLAYQWQKQEIGGAWENLSNGGAYSNVTTNAMQISPIAQNMSLVKYKAIVSTSAFLCDSDLTSNEAVLTVKEDTDDDGVSNDSDLDDDNDGILDADENSGGNSDIDSDGTPNNLDIDADGDGCNDVIEAGFVDGDNNGILGTDPVVVNNFGIVTDWAGKTAANGYTAAKDLDANGVKDYKEAGGKVTSITNPASITISDKRNVSFTVASVALGGVSTQWQESSDNGQNWSNLVNSAPYGGVTTNTLQITNATLALSGNQYRALLSTSSYVCDQDTASVGAILTVLPDKDEDNVQDIYDLDDDNDGILDTEEGFGDLDLDGIPNLFDLDSDGDNCFDAVEAGFADPDNNGILGSGTSVGNVGTDVIVDAQGRVIKNNDNSNVTGYATPQDLDANNTKDYLEKGSQAQITVQPVNKTVLESNSVSLTVTGTSNAYISYKWQRSTTDCNTWSDITESPALMITGVLKGDRNGSSWPRIVELFAVRDIPNLAAYGLDIAQDGANSTQPDNALGANGWNSMTPANPAMTLQKGQYLLVEYSNWANGQHNYEFFGDQIPASSVDHKFFRFHKTNQMSGDDPVVLYKRPDPNSNSGWAQIDIFGVNNQDGTGQPWEYTEGWAYRKNGRTSSTVFSLNDWKMCNGCVDGMSLNSAAANPYPIMTFRNPQEFAGPNTNTLTINNVPFTMNQNKYRVILSTPSFACGNDVASTCATLTVSQDSDRDNDGVGDSQDLDADNDGILNTVEGTGDTDGDGQPDYLDLDSDNDGCNDVLEAGFTDSDNDGFLGLSAGNPTELLWISMVW